MFLKPNVYFTKFYYYNAGQNGSGTKTELPPSRKIPGPLNCVNRIYRV